MKKEQLEKLVHRKLLWHEYTDKGTYIEGGLCSNANPVRIMVRTSGNSYENIESKGFIKCDGVRDFEPIEKFDDGKMCLSCPNRQASCFSAADAVPTSAFNIDLTARNEGRLVSTHQVIVPSGCPHSLGEPAEQGRKGKEVAASLVGSWNEKDTVPFSWKIVENGDKLTLSIPYTLPSRDIHDWTLLLDEGTDEEFYIDKNRPHFTIEQCDVAYGGSSWCVKVWFTADGDVWDTTEYSDVCPEPQAALDNMFVRLDLN